MILEITIETVAMIIITLGIGYLVRGQWFIRKEAKNGRNLLHTKIDELVKQKIDPALEKLTEVRSCHNINHPEQLKLG